MEVRPDRWNETQFLPSSAVVSILLYGCTTLTTLTKRMEKKLDGNSTRMLRAILNKSWKQYPTKHQLYGYLPPIAKTIKIRRTRHEKTLLVKQGRAHKWCSPMDPPHMAEQKQDDHLEPTYSSSVLDTGCSSGDLPEAMNDREEWRERVRDIRAGVTTWWWWKPLVWLRYIDYTFVLWPLQEDVKKLLDHLNSIRPSIQFIIEKE